MDYDCYVCLGDRKSARYGQGVVLEDFCVVGQSHQHVHEPGPRFVQVSRCARHIRF